MGYPRQLNVLVAPSRIAFRPRLALAGASLCNRNGYSAGTSPVTVGTGFFHWFQAFNYYPFDIVANGGIGGQTLAAVETNFAVDVLANSPDIVVLCGDAPGNSVNNGVIASNVLITLDSLIARMEASNIVVVLCTIPPNGQLSAGNDASGAKGQQTQIYNDGVMARCRANPKLILFHWGEHQVDLTETTGRYVTTSSTGAASTAWVHDQTHSHPKDAIKRGQLMGTILTSLLGLRTLPLPSTNTHPYKAILNPVNFGTTGTLAGGATGAFVGANCTLTGSGVTSIADVARTDFADNGVWKRIVTTLGVGNVTYQFTGVGSIPANMVAGTTPIFAVCEIMLNATPTSLRGFQITLSFAGSAITYTGFNTATGGTATNLADAGPYIPLATKILLFTPVGILPAAATNFAITVEASKSSLAANMAVDFQVGRASIIVAPVVPSNATALVVP